MYATGKQSEALCDFCGFRCKYLDLKRDILNQVWTGFMVCPDCYQKDPEQLQVWREARDEGIPLENPRSNSPDFVMRGYAGWNPVFGLLNAIGPGQVTVTTT